MNTQTDLEINDFIKQNMNVLYKKTSDDIGSRNKEGGKEHKHTIDGKFTKVSISLISLTLKLFFTCLAFSQ